ncbi:LytR C-terminal domain-containing protein [Eubacterium sp. MSJ-13]|uniref:LytR C-terminal domain-containing protein n=1 Tax=Eubacterium sp. MSJ-13 TaxID=2841513 RepID=UPI001C118229|nr:LytR C-terminal domain-containing protein [Eubacterium sp. MSJ-13]MBU5478376.1 LytR C-terminal domain-containing protein [Eubacterium sp. MSJ-13]
MKKKNIAKVFALSLLKSILFILLIIAVGFASYKISYMVLSNNSENVGTSSNEIKDIIEEAQTDEISKNLIYVSDENKISHLILEICNTNTNNMDYITIPVGTDYTIPTDMYQRLSTVNEEIPQIVRIGRLKQYFQKDDDAYGYGELIIEKMLGVKISYYTVIDRETYISHYARRNVNVKFKPLSLAESENDRSVTVTEKINVASESYINQLKDIKGDQKKIAEFIKQQYERVDSNLTVYNKIGYVECYEKLDPELFHYWGIPGKYTDNIFQVDTKASKLFIDNLVNNDTTYTQAQVFDRVARTSTKSSKGKSIIVLNGSKIGGLASAAKTKLTNAGYKVKKIGDYTAATLTQTKIIVKEDGAGKDLVQYFSNPVIETGTVESGYDIKIIIGTADANN